MKVIITNSARQSLRNIYEYYKALGNGKKGRKIRTKITKHALKLKEFPNLGRKEEYLEHLGLDHKYLVVDTYKIIYRIDGQFVYITDIFDTRQDSKKMKS